MYIQGVNVYRGSMYIETCEFGQHQVVLVEALGWPFVKQVSWPVGVLEMVCG